MNNRLVEILETILLKITDGSDMIWTTYGTALELRKKINQHIKELKNNNLNGLNDLYVLFLPT